MPTIMADKNEMAHKNAPGGKYYITEHQQHKTHINFVSSN